MEGKSGRKIMKKKTWKTMKKIKNMWGTLLFYGANYESVQIQETKKNDMCYKIEEAST